MSTRYWLTICTLFCILTCEAMHPFDVPSHEQKHRQHPLLVKAALEHAGPNRSSLEQMLAYYQPDSMEAWSSFGSDKGECNGIVLRPVFNTSGPKISFSASGDFYINSIKYKKKLRLSVYYNEETHFKSISID